MLGPWQMKWSCSAQSHVSVYRGNVLFWVHADLAVKDNFFLVFPKLANLAIESCSKYYPACADKRGQDYPHFLASTTSLTRAEKMLHWISSFSAPSQGPVLALMSFITTDTGLSNSPTWGHKYWHGVYGFVNLAPFFKTELTGVAGVQL